MNKRAVAELTVKLIAFYFAILTITSLVNSVGAFLAASRGQDLPNKAPLILIAIPAGYLLFCYWLISKASLIAAKLVQAETPDSLPPFSIHDAMVLTISAIGLLTLTAAVPLAAKMLTRYYVIPHLKYPDLVRQLTGPAPDDVVELAVKFLIGLVLFLLPDRIAARLQLPRPSTK